MRTAVLIAAAAAALTLTACNRTDEAATADASTEAAEASGAAMDTAATTGAGGSGGANATGGAGSGGSAGSASGETMSPATGSNVNDGAMAPAAQPGDTAGNNVTETERRLNPPTPQ